MRPNEDPTEDLNKLMDEAHMVGSYYLQGKLSMPQLVMKQRAILLEKLRAYIVRRDHEMFNEGAKSNEKN